MYLGRNGILTLTVGALIVVLAGWKAGFFFRSSPSPDPDPQLELAKAALASRDYPQALAHLTSCLESCPFNGEAHFLLAHAYRIVGNIGDAQKHLNQAAILHWPMAQIDLEHRLQRVQVGNLWQDEDFLLTTLNRRPPEEVVILEALVNGLMENDRLADVIVVSSAWINRFPKDWLPRIYRGNAFLRLQIRIEDAIQDFQWVLDLKPDNPESHLSMAIIRTREGDYEKALPHFKACVDLQPNDPQTLFGLANCYFSLGKMPEARETLAQLFATGKEDAAAFLVQAKIELAESGAEKAMPWLKKADALAPKEVDVINNLMLVSGQLGQKEQADKYRQMLEEINARDADLHKLETAVIDHPLDINLRFQLGVACLKHGRNEQAAHWFQSILWKDPDHLPTLKALADYYASIGNSKMSDHYRRKEEKIRGLTPTTTPDNPVLNSPSPKR